jgi:hypothetical protein
MRRGTLTLVVWVVAGCSAGGGSLSATSPDPPLRQATGRLEPEPGRPVSLPTRVEADRFFLVPVSEDGHELSLCTDTAGGSWLSREAAERAGLSVVTVEGEEGPVEAALLPTFAWDAWIPKLEALGGRVPVTQGARLSFLGANVDGLLGQAWFGDRVWTFDYEAGELLQRADGDLPKHEPASRLPVGFKTDESGKRLSSYPRVDVKIGGATVSMLLATGATARLSPAARGALGDDLPAIRATSFVSAATFDAWRTSHAAWRVLEGADELADGAAMIEVPTVEIAGHSVGPVWFSRRADASFVDWTARAANGKVDGALGGNALRFFRLSLDYPRRLAVFERITGR